MPQDGKGTSNCVQIVPAKEYKWEAKGCLRKAPAVVCQSTSPVPEEPEPTPEGTPTYPEPSEPGPTKPEPTEPGPTEPGPTKPEPTEPGPTEPGPTEPEPTGPGPTDEPSTGYPPDDITYEPISGWVAFAQWGALYRAYKPSKNVVSIEQAQDNRGLVALVSILSPNHTQNWGNAYTFCQGLGSNTEMAKVKTEKQQEVIEAFIKGYKIKGAKFWLGGQDFVIEGEFDLNQVSTENIRYTWICTKKSHKGNFRGTSANTSH